MDPTKRSLLKVRIEDAIADRARVLHKIKWEMRIETEKKIC